MGIISKGLVYTGIFAMGMMTGYTSCTNQHYKVIEENGKVYVQDNKTGRRADVDDDFDAKKDSKNSRGFGDRVKDAYDSLVK